MSLKPFDNMTFQMAYARWAGLADLSDEPEQRVQELIIDFINGAFLCGYWHFPPEDDSPYEKGVEELRKKVNLDTITETWITLHDIQIAQRFDGNEGHDLLYQLGNAIYRVAYPTEAVILPPDL